MMCNRLPIKVSFRNLAPTVFELYVAKNCPGEGGKFDVISSRFVFLLLVNQGGFPTKIDQSLVFPLCYAFGDDN